MRRIFQITFDTPEHGRERERAQERKKLYTHIEVYTSYSRSLFAGHIEW